ncbi:MAG TPA: cysteine desulfurase [candidate division Zixibacteria bacterium]|nr:cysteine desulfurase [candidate division Zixibacteria bacterium]
MQTKPKNNDTAVLEKQSFDVSSIKVDFPIFGQEINGHRLVYLDSAASSQKPRAVINAIDRFYSTDNANIHRGLHALAERATSAYEHSRSKVAKFLGGVSREEIIFTSGTTAGINLLSYSLGEQVIKDSDEILITEMEHHANLVPWVMLAKRKNAVLKRIPLTKDGRLDLTKVSGLLSNRTKIVALTHMSNVLGTINPVADIADAAHKKGALVVVDGAQAAPHMPVNVKDLGVDFYAFSAHKMLGPTGVGILYGRRELLETLPPFMTGGEMIREVHFDKVTWNEVPHKFEAGTPHIAGAITFETAIDYLEQIGMENIRQHEIELTEYAIENLLKVDGLEIQGPLDSSIRGSAISFTVPDIHPHDISTFLDSKGIAIRAGHHCAQPLMRALGKIATARASFYLYNDESDVDALVEALTEIKKYFRI